MKKVKLNLKIFYLLLMGLLVTVCACVANDGVVATDDKPNQIIDDKIDSSTNDGVVATDDKPIQIIDDKIDSSTNDGVVATDDKPIQIIDDKIDSSTNDGVVVTDDKPYQIIDGKIDSNTFEGWRTYNGGGCGQCHGRGGSGKSEGMNLAESLVIKNSDKKKFKNYITNGVPNTRMKPHKNDGRVMRNLDNLYSYLKARADGILGPENLIKNPLGK